MDDRRALLVGDVVGEQFVDPVDRREVQPPGHLGLRLLELPVPAAQLPGDVVLVATEVRQTNGLQVDLVDGGEHVDERLAGPAPGVGRELLGLVDRTDHPTVDEVHDVEGRAVDPEVLAVSDGRWHRYRRRGQRGHDLVFAAHVVGGGQHLGERGSPQHPPVPRPVGHGVGQVRVSSGDELEAERRAGVPDVLGEPGGDGVGIDPVGDGVAVGHARSVLLVLGCGLTHASASSSRPDHRVVPGR